MCGIAGWLLVGGRHPDAADETLRAMCAAMQHRGPDDEGVLVGRAGALGMRRLSIIDVAGGHQPISNEDGTCHVVLNGEIYNHEALRKELEPRHRFATRSDTEVVLRLLEEEGPAGVARLDGMFALAFLDERRGRLILARDRFGKKPLYWSERDGRLWFGSELTTLLAAGLPRRLDPRGVEDYLTFGYAPTPRTLLDGVRRLRPGHVMEVAASGERREEAYWSLDYEPKADLTLEEAAGALDRLLHESVERRLMSEVPLGVYLSGGVDSSLVAAAMADLVEPSRIDAFTIGFDDARHDETPYAREAAQTLGVRHHVRAFTEDEALRVVPRVLERLDEPMADPSLLPTHLLASFARETITVALSGDGGDELFAGYPKHAMVRTADALARSPAWLRRGAASGARMAARAVPVLGRSKAPRFVEGLAHPPHVRTQAWIANFLGPERDAVLARAGDAPFAAADEAARAFRGKAPVDLALHMDVSLTLLDMYLVKADRASMMASLEVRSPFLDAAVAGFAARLPVRLKVRGREGKLVPRALARRRFRAGLVDRPKQGFGVPLGRWLRGALAPLVDDALTPERLRATGLRPEGVRRLVARQRAGRDEHAPQVWSLLALQSWARRWEVAA